jgi:hypothetical protein
MARERRLGQFRLTKISGYVEVSGRKLLRNSETTFKEELILAYYTGMCL